MQYLKLDSAQRDALWASLCSMPDYLDDCFAKLDAAEARQGGAAGEFAPVEQVWHLADLEREGFGVRLARLLSETAPALADFDGTAVAARRNYRGLSLHEGLIAFRQARTANLATLRGVAADAWVRSGTQDGIGAVSLCDMPGLMSQHDAVHRSEIEAWKQQHERR